MEPKPLKITKAHDASTARGECIDLHVLEDIPNLSEFIIIDNTYDDKDKSNKHRHFYRFPTGYKASARDFIYVHTGLGRDRVIKFGTISFFHFYMNLKTPIWNNDGDRIEVYKLGFVDSHIMSKTEKPI